jgi:hypothetical protein
LGNGPEQPKAKNKTTIRKLGLRLLKKEVNLIKNMLFKSWLINSFSRYNYFYKKINKYPVFNKLNPKKIKKTRTEIHLTLFKY